MMGVRLLTPITTDHARRPPSGKSGRPLGGSFSVSNDPASGVGGKLYASPSTEGVGSATSFLQGASSLPVKLESCKGAVRML